MTAQPSTPEITGPTPGKPHATEPAVSRARATGGPTVRALLAGMLVFAALLAPLPSPVFAQAVKPYDSKLLRLAEILGAVHYLRELCGANEGQFWRDKMRTLIRAEGTTAIRRARLTRSFNEGYRSYSRTYKVCTSSAKTAVERFLEEGAGIAETMLKDSR